MKKIIALLSTLVMSSVAMADPVLLTHSRDEKTQWYGYSETFTAYKDGYSVLVSERESGIPENRYYIGITKTDCARGFGVLKSRVNEGLEWVVVSNVTPKNPSLVADFLAAQLCNAGANIPVVKKSQKV